MSSLRLALKQSLEETTASTPPPPPPVPALPPPGRTSPHGPTGSGSVASFHTEEDSTSPVPKKRGPGRPRKYPRSHDQPPRKRGRPRKNPPMSDEDAFSSENEFSVGGDVPESEHTQEHSTMSHNAASTIQSHWKKTKGKPNMLEESVVAEPPSSITAESKNETSSQATREDVSTAPAPAPTNQSKPVTPPAQDVIDWMRNMPVKRARKAVAPGLRVKVRFVTKVKKEGKVTRKRIWYGGRITAVSKEGSKIRIKYDDKTSEVTQFPDKDVVIDDYLNGKHQANANRFIPPEQHDDEDEDEDLFGEGGTGEAEKPHETQSTRTKEPQVAEEAKPKAELSGSSSKVFAVEVAPPNVKKVPAKKEHGPEKTKPSGSGMKETAKSFSEMSAMPSQTEGHSEPITSQENQLDSDRAKKVDDKNPASAEVTEKAHPPGESLGIVPPLEGHAVAESKHVVAEPPKPSVTETPMTEKLTSPVDTPPRTVVDESLAPAETVEKVPEAVPAEPPKETPVLTSQNQPATHSEEDSSGMVIEKASTREDLVQSAVEPASEEVPTVPMQVEKSPEATTDMMDVEKITDSAEPPVSSAPLAEEKPTLLPEQDATKEIPAPANETAEPSQTEKLPSVVETPVDPPKETPPATESMEVATQETKSPALQVSAGESATVGEQTEEKVTNEEVLGPSADGNGDEVPAQENEVPPKEETKILASSDTSMLPATDTPKENESKETSCPESPMESKVAPTVEPTGKEAVLEEPATTEPMPKTPTEPAVEDAPIREKPVDTAKEAKEVQPGTSNLEETGDTGVPATAAKVDVASSEPGEEPVKPKRKRGRPPKHRPPADSAPQGKDQKGSMVTEQPAADHDSSEKGEKSNATKKSASSESAGKDASTSAKSEGKEASSKPSLTIRIPNLKKVDGKQATSAKKGDAKREATSAVTDAEAPRGKKRSSAAADNEEPPAKRIHIHIGSKSSQENLSDHSDKSTEKGGTSRSATGSSSKHLNNGGDATLAKDHGAMSPKPKKAKRKRDRDADSTPRVGAKPNKKVVDHGDGAADSTQEPGERRQDLVEETFGTPDARIKAEQAARSGRRAAQQANERISSKNDPPADQATKKKKKRRRDMEEGEGEPEEIPAFQWVQCDKCAKWRIIPSSVVETLPPLWYCADNKWDAKRASCDAPEQTPKQVAKERKKKKRKLMMEREALEAAEREAAAATGETADVSSSPRNSDDAADAHRASPSENSFDSKHGSDPSNKSEKKGVSSTKKTKTPTVVETTPLPEEEPKPRGRGRPRRNPPKEASTPSAPPTNPNSSQPPATDEADNLEWVQCEKCDKWRKLPPHISADELPDVWYCSMNTWNPGSASCSAPEDKAEGLQDIFNNNAASGKLSYRNLIFGSNGRKHNRPISERTRAAESLFAAVSDDSDAPPAVMYANSSAFICRSKHQQSDENEGPTVLDLMSRSHLWTQLQKTQSKATPLVFDALSTQARESLKDIVLHCLGAQTLTGEQLHQQVGERSWENDPVGWAAVRKYCTENMLVMAMCELVRMGVLECFRLDGPLANGQLWTLCYRRARAHSAVPAAAAAAPKVDLPSNGPRSLKFAKPWKKTHMAT